MGFGIGRYWDNMIKSYPRHLAEHFRLYRLYVYITFVSCCRYNLEIFNYLCVNCLALLPSSSHLFAFIAALAVIAIISIGFFTTNLHYKIQILEDQLRSKIGEYNSVYLA